MVNKANKFGCEYTYEELGTIIKETSHGHIEYDDQYHCEVRVEDFKSMDTYYVVEVSGKSVISGWEMVASVEYLGKDKNLIFQMGDTEVPSVYYNTDCFCEHCNSKRLRKFTYIVKNTASGEFKQIGKSCLRDFTFGIDGEWIARQNQFLKDIEADTCWESGSFWRSCQPNMLTEEAILYMVETYKKFGYKPNGGTATQAYDFYRFDHNLMTVFDKVQPKYGIDRRSNYEIIADEKALVDFNHNRPENHEMMEKMLAWLNDEKTYESNWIHNLRAVTSEKYTTRKNFNILASLLPAFDKELAKMEEKARIQEERKSIAESSKFVAEIGDRIVIHAKEISCVWSGETQYGTYTFLYIITDTKGNQYKWSGSKAINEDNLTKWEWIKATVKDHKEYNGVKQTVITRGTNKVKENEKVD